MEREDDQYDKGEDLKDGEDLAGIGHVQEYAEDVQGKQGNDELLDGAGDGAPELREEELERRQFTMGDAKSEDERKDQSRHDIHHRRDADREIGLEPCARIGYISRVSGFGYKRGKEGFPDSVSKGGGDCRVQICNDYGH